MTIIVDSIEVERGSVPGAQLVQVIAASELLREK
jgi:hypothetical protein